MCIRDSYHITPNSEKDTDNKYLFFTGKGSSRYYLHYIIITSCWTSKGYYSCAVPITFAFPQKYQLLIALKNLNNQHPRTNNDTIHLHLDHPIYISNLSIDRPNYFYFNCREVKFCVNKQ